MNHTDRNLRLSPHRAEWLFAQNNFLFRIAIIAELDDERRKQRAADRSLRRHPFTRWTLAVLRGIAAASRQWIRERAGKGAIAKCKMKIAN